ncbi:MAG: histidine kinase [Polaromonas sp.]|nr:histidine kinase [Polaromonas sp.]
MRSIDDQGSSEYALFTTSQKMLALKDEVLSCWEEEVRNSIEQAKSLAEPVLIDTLPLFYDHLAESVSPDIPRTNATSGTTVATAHGAERARLTSYDIKAIILEYQLLRTSLLGALKLNGVAVTEEERQVIDTSIDGAIRESVSAYVVSMTALRERVISALMHDLRNPLGVASMAAQLIAHKSESPDIQKLAGKIVENQQNMDRMLHELLDAIVSKTGSQLLLHLSSFNLLQAVQDVCDQAEVRHGPRFKIIGQPVDVFWDLQSFRRALENLLSNAVKYGAPTTSISVRLIRNDGRMAVSVHNAGNPIAADEIENIFKVFERASAARQSSKEGWGIGLPFVRLVTESHGGSTMVDSSLERGTTFIMDMPIDAQPFQNAKILAT